MSDLNKFNSNNFLLLLFINYFNVYLQTFCNGQWFLKLPILNHFINKTCQDLCNYRDTESSVLKCGTISCFPVYLKIINDYYKFQITKLI